MVNQGQNSDMGFVGIKNGQTNSEFFYIYESPFTFLIDLFLEAREEILEKISLVFLGDLKKTKRTF